LSKYRKGLTDASPDSVRCFAGQQGRVVAPRRRRLAPVAEDNAFYDRVWTGRYLSDPMRSCALQSVVLSQRQRGEKMLAHKATFAAMTTQAGGASEGR
jgi:hypothetical protein